MALTTSLRAQASCSLSKTSDLGTPQASLNLLIDVALASGTTDTQADRAWGDTRTLAPSTAEDLDLNGVLFDEFGAAFNLLDCPAILMSAAAANVNNVVVGNAASNGFVGPFGAAAHTIAIKPGGFFFWFSPAGFTVTAGTGDLWHVLNGGAGTSVDYSILIIGRSA